MPTLRKMIDNGDLDMEAASPLAKHVASNLQDPIGQTKDMFEGLSKAQLEYEMKKEEAKRALAPVKSVIQHVEDTHELAPDEEEGYDPNLQGDPSMMPGQMPGQPMPGQKPMPGQMPGQKAPMAGMPAKPGMAQPMPGPGGKTSYPGAGPKLGQPMMGPNGKPAAAAPPGAGQMRQPSTAQQVEKKGTLTQTPKKKAAASTGGRQIKVHVSANGYGIQAGGRKIADVLGGEQLRTATSRKGK